MSAPPYVATADIKAAVRGHETEVLDALGIAWRTGRPHIDCPYPDHGGASDWRWDSNAAKAFCTCIPKGDSILDVVMRVERLDFDAAKIRVTELIGQPELIRNNGHRYNATDAASLLNAPADQRDDRLPIAYLAHRLGVGGDAVPIPRTPMAGLKAVAYFDPPPPRSNAKPTRLGEFPCAVFGTIAADGRTHAHRIYLSAGGSGKAELGAGPDGKPRDAKKSARVIGADNTAGRAVLWGNAERAPHIVVIEGVETGAAVALAMTTEIASGEVAVAAAITAGGIEAFQPYPATTRVTVAADRDEAAKANGRPGSRRGEQAARVFGEKQHARIRVGIALPGEPGESVDRLDILRRVGVDAVRAGILAASPFAPDSQERVPTDGLITACADTIVERPIEWLWPGRIALGKLSLISGDPGLGKSQLATLMAAKVSAGGKWPVDHTPCPPGEALILSAEDDPADTIVPRLRAAGADLSKIQISGGLIARGNQRVGLTLDTDCADLERAIAGMGGDCRLAIIDPPSAFLGRTDSHSNAEVRGVLAKLADIAARYRVAIVMISHLNKSGGGNAIYRATGSLAFVAAARSAYLVAKDQNNPQRRLLLPAKNNLAPDRGGLAFTVITNSQGIPVLSFEPDPVTDITADDAVAPPPREANQRDEAESWLRAYLASGPRPVSEIKTDAAASGIAEITLRRAKAKLGVEKFKQGGAIHGGWFWRIAADDDQPNSENGPQGDQGDQDDHLAEASDHDHLEHVDHLQRRSFPKDDHQNCLREPGRESAVHQPAVATEDEWTIEI